MSFSHSILQNLAGNGRTIGSSKAYTGDGQESRKIDVAGSVTDQLVNFALDVGQIKAIYMKSNVDLTVETNSASVPDDTINLLAGIPYIWYTGSYFANLLTTDVTALYLTNAGAVAAVFELEVVHDSTP